ncbi:unnamed protein product [Ixodes persulcatus]
MPFNFKKDCMSRLVNAVPLSETIKSGSPYVANILRSRSITADECIDVIITTSALFEKASTATRKTAPSTGPAKSICTRLHARSGFVHKCVGAFGSLCRFSWHALQCRTNSSICASIFGHQT